MSSWFIRRANVSAGGSEPTPRLPAEFKELAYIEGTGTQYIKTTYARSSGNGYRMVVDLEPSNYNAGQYFFSIGEDWSGYFVGIYNGHVALYTNAELTTTGRMTLTLTIATDNKTCTLSDGTDSVTYTRSSANYSGKTMLFARQTNNYLGKCKIYSAQVYKNDVLAMDLVPAMRKADSAVGFYDLVSGSFLINNGSGSFNYGEL